MRSVAWTVPASYAQPLRLPPLFRLTISQRYCPLPSWTSSVNAVFGSSSASVGATDSGRNTWIATVAAAPQAASDAVTTSVTPGTGPAR